MRRLHGGLLAAALLLIAGCGSGRTTDTAARTSDATAIRTPTLAVSSRVSAAAKPDAETLTVLVTSPDGVSSAGLDAAVSVLMERPELEVVVVAASVTGTDGAVTDGQTMSGFPAHVIAATAPDPVASAIDLLGLDVDLVVVGVAEGAALGTGIESSAVGAATREARSLGLPVLAVTAGTDHGADLAAAGVMLRSLLDIDLDALLEPGARLLTVPSCVGGLVRGPVPVPASMHESSADAVDCQNGPRHDPVDDVEAHGRGFATLVEHGA